MDIKEHILNVLRSELEPFGYRYVKSESKFKRKVDKDTIVYLYYCASRHHRGLTTVTFYANGDYRDLKKEFHNQKIIDNIEYWHFGFCSRLQWLMPRTEAPSPWDYVFRDDDTEEIVNERLRKMAWCVRTYLVTFMERLSHKSSALKEAVTLDHRFLLVGNKFLVPIMYCVWKHDKKAALDYIEEKRLKKLALVETREWDRLERMKEGEQFTQEEWPTYALLYEEYVEESKKIKEWIESLNYD